MSHHIPLRSCSTDWVLSGFADEAGESCEAQIAAIKRAGFSHIDLRGIDKFNITVLPLDHAETIKKKLDAAGIAVGMYGTPLGKIDIADDFKIDMDKLEHVGKLASIFGCRAVRIFSYFNKNKASMTQWRDESLSRLKRLRDRAAELDLVLYHENESHIYGDTSEHVLEIAHALRDKPGASKPAFKMIYDFDNYNRTGKPALAIWAEHKNLTDAFHLKDSDAEGRHTPVGEGIGAARQILSEALAMGFAGPVSLEPHLQHSAAVMATGPSGQANQKYSEMSAADVFHVAAEAAKKLLGEIKAPVV